MWTFYLDAMQMMQSYDDDHIQLKQRLLKEAYTSAESANRLTEPHYIHYINYLKENVNDPQELYDVSKSLQNVLTKHNFINSIFNTGDFACYHCISSCYRHMVREYASSHSA